MSKHVSSTRVVSKEGASGEQVEGICSVNSVISCSFRTSTVAKRCPCIGKGRDKRRDWDRDAYMSYGSASIPAWNGKGVGG